MRTKIVARRSFSVLATAFILTLLISGCGGSLAGERTTAPSATPTVNASTQPESAANDSPSPRRTETVETSRSSVSTFVKLDPWNDPEVQLLEPDAQSNTAFACGSPLGPDSATVSCITDARCVLNPASTEALCLADERVLGLDAPFDLSKWVHKSLEEKHAEPAISSNDERGMLIAVELEDGRICVGSNAGGAEPPPGFNGLWGVCDDKQLIWRPGAPDQIDLNAPFLDPEAERLRVAVSENYAENPSEVEVESVFY